MVGDQCEQRAQGVFAVVQRSWNGLHSAVLLSHRQQSGGKYPSSELQAHLTLVFKLETRVDGITWGLGGLQSWHILWEVCQLRLDWEQKKGLKQMWEQLIAMVIQKSYVGCPELIDNDYDNLEMATRKFCKL